MNLCCRLDSRGAFNECQQDIPLLSRRNMKKKYLCVEFRLYWPGHAKTYFRAYSDSERPDQTAHLRSLIRAFTVR